MEWFRRLRYFFFPKRFKRESMFECWVVCRFSYGGLIPFEGRAALGRVSAEQVGAVGHRYEFVDDGDLVAVGFYTSNSDKRVRYSIRFITTQERFLKNYGALPVMTGQELGAGVSEFLNITLPEYLRQIGESVGS